ncbi:MAG: hypothetical protein ACFE95_02600 [Candidatus Hodarchaeota archaeon]
MILISIILKPGSLEEIYLDITPGKLKEKLKSFNFEDFFRKRYRDKSYYKSYIVRLNNDKVKPCDIFECKQKIKSQEISAIDFIQIRDRIENHLWRVYFRTFETVQKLILMPPNFQKNSSDVLKKINFYEFVPPGTNETNYLYGKISFSYGFHRGKVKNFGHNSSKKCQLYFGNPIKELQYHSYLILVKKDWDKCLTNIE